ncbi:MAG TPA: hypothetical protein VIH59_25685 [Candidatus Tectomicrobia bacterium]|jgi:hypothetical protein
MPHVIEDPEILTHPSPAATGDAPRARRACPRFLALFQHLITPPPGLQTRQQEHNPPGAPQFETPLDLLARRHPNLHLWLMSVIG